MATRYRNNIAKVMANYPPGSTSLLIALDALLGTVIEQTKGRNETELAESTCTGTLHQGAPKGVICRKCYDAIEAGRAPQDDPAEGLLVGKDKAAEEEIERQVRQMIGAPEIEE